MKIAMTRYEKFALTSHLVGQPSPSPEHGRKRLRTWDELGVTDLADKLASLGSGLGNVEIRTADWSDKATPEEVEVSELVRDHVLAGLSGQVAGVWADTITRLRDRFEKAK